MGNLEGIIQNALYLNTTDEVVISTQRHELISFSIGIDEMSIDGGCDYIKWSGPVKEHIDCGDITSLILCAESSFEDMAYRLCWAVRDDRNYQHKRLWDLSSEHLRSIIRTQKLSSRYKNVINYILVSRLPKIQKPAK